MTKTYQAEHFTGAQLDGVMQKVLSGEMAGKGLEFDAEGNLNCAKHGYSRLLYSYTHTGNPQAQPTALDITTGIYTAPKHGFTNLMPVYAAMNGQYNIGAPYRYLPGGLELGVASNTGNAQMYYCRVIDEDHFAISKESTGDYLTYTSTADTDVSTFHFENIGTHELIIEGVDVRECLLVINGKILNNIRWIHPTGKLMFANSKGNQTGAKAYDAAMGTDTFGSCYFGRPGFNYVYGMIEFQMRDGRHVTQVNNVDYVLYSTGGAPTILRNRQYYHMRLSGDTIEGITMYGDQYGGFFNGTTVEVYAR